MRTYLTRLWRDESGISSVEYALLLAFVGGGIILAADALSTAVSDEMNNTAGCIDGTFAPDSPECSDAQPPAQ